MNTTKILRIRSYLFSESHIWLLDHADIIVNSRVHANTLSAMVVTHVLAKPEQVKQMQTLFPHAKYEKNLSGGVVLRITGELATTNNIIQTILRDNAEEIILVDPNSHLPSRRAAEDRLSSGASVCLFKNDATITLFFQVWHADMIQELFAKQPLPNRNLSIGFRYKIWLSLEEVVERLRMQPGVVILE